jgi:hypothetical protein
VIFYKSKKDEIQTINPRYSIDCNKSSFFMAMMSSSRGATAAVLNKTFLNFRILHSDEGKIYGVQINIHCILYNFFG